MLKPNPYRLFGTILLLTGISIFFSCKKKEDAPPEKIDYSYFPVDSGRYFIYEVDSVIADQFKGTRGRKGSCQIKDVITGTFRDNSNRLTYEISRYQRSGDTSTWNFLNVYAANLTTTTAEVFIDNTRYLKLTFPVEGGRKWNGNTFNTLGVQQYQYTSIGQTVSISGKNYPNTVTVLQDNEANAIHKKYALEQYAQNVGMIYKINIDDSIYSSSIDPTMPFDSLVTGGVEVRMYLKSTGK